MTPDREERMPDLTIKPLTSGNFELSQQWGLDDPLMMELHPVQIRLLAERAGVLSAPDPRMVERWGGAHIKRILSLSKWIEDMRDLYNDEIIDRCGSGIEISLYLRTIAELSATLAAEVLPLDDPGPQANEQAALPLGVES